MPSFHCRQCGSCCRQPGYVYITENDAKLLAAGLRLDLYDFTDRFCEVLEKRHLVLKQYPDEKCIFLEGTRCAVYETRPAQCRDFPLRWDSKRRSEYCKGKVVP
ncbi:MAG: Flagellin N-methylase [Candidatus Omnitrophica bacterium ADurb.Bin277]|nr:MAG: Flagellin N-methylase [Candidatus Omnitrophica bacterium ADurb.Bin277]